jgi:hypothetical protein
MSFSRAQQGQFRTMVGYAWTAFLKENPAAQKCRKNTRCAECDFCIWYEGALLEATGYRSTTDCNPGRDFNSAMAQFEVLAGAGIYWSVKQQKADRERVLWVLRKYATDHGFPEQYLEAIARTPFERGKRGTFPGLDALTSEDLVKVLGAVKRQVLRKRKPEAVADPF